MNPNTDNLYRDVKLLSPDAYLLTLKTTELILMHVKANAYQASRIEASVMNHTLELLQLKQKD